MRVAREAGSAALGSGLLTAAAGFVVAQSRVLSAEVNVGCCPKSTQMPTRRLRFSALHAPVHLACSPSVQVLASLHCLLSAARFQPAEPLEFGARVVERLLRLAHTQQGAGLNLKAFADVVRWCGGLEMGSSGARGIADASLCCCLSVPLLGAREHAVQSAAMSA